MSKVATIEGCINFTRGFQTTFSGIGAIIPGESRLLGIRPGIGFCKFVGICKVVAAVPGAANGTLFIEQSVDSVNWDEAQTFSLGLASATLSFSVEVTGIFIRARFVVPVGENYTIRFGGFLDPIGGGAGGGGGGGAISVKGSPGLTITTQADVVIGIGTTVPLGLIPVNTRRFSVQNTGPAGTWVRVREVGSAAGVGRLMPRLGEYTYGGADGAIAQLEVEDVSLAVGGVAVATTIMVQYERD
jgi:hypothetical protein